MSELLNVTLHLTSPNAKWTSHVNDIRAGDRLRVVRRTVRTDDDGGYEVELGLMTDPVPDRSIVRIIAAILSLRYLRR